MADKIRYTLDPEVLMAIAKLPWPNSIAFDEKDFLDTALGNVELDEATKTLVKEYFGSYDSFFVAVCRFLEDNKFIPDVEEPKQEDGFDSIDNMDDRDW